MESPNDKLVRGLGPLDATMIVIGSMIGSGIFITSAESTRLIGAPGWLLLAWVMAGVMTMTGALCCAELAAMLPRAGGQYVFLRQAYGPSIGFLFGWTLFLVIQTGTIAAVAIAFAKFAGVFLPAIAPESYLVRPVHLFGGYALSLSSEQLVAILLIFFLTWINTRGLEIGKLVQNTFTFAKTAALIGLIVIGLSLGWKATCAACASAQQGQRGGQLERVVESVGERLDAAGGPTWPNDDRRARACRYFRQGDGWSALRPDRLDECHFHRE